MQALYFGHSNCPLYGVVHEPSAANRSAAIVICQPIGHEYFRTHRAITLLAEQLAQQGYYVLRFDYSGTGDSYGDLSSITLDQWINDTRLAEEEIRAISGCESSICIGVRLGAAIAQLAHSTSTRQYLFWDPVFNGGSWIEQLDVLQNRVLNDSWWFRQSRQQDLVPSEKLGTVFSSSLVEQIKQIAINHVITRNFAFYSEQAVVEVNLPAGLQHSVMADNSNWNDERAIDRVLSVPLMQKAVVESLA